MFKTIIEIGFSLGLFANVMLFVPQILKLYKLKKPQGLSIITFGGFNLIQAFTMMHGYLANDYILFFGSLLSLITCGTVTMLIFWYSITSKEVSTHDVSVNGA